MLINKCLYCGAETNKQKFCNLDHKKLFMEKQNKINIQSDSIPIIKSRGLTDKEIKMQEDFLKRKIS